jgi:Ca2+-binding EF-hand superfamily protein
MDVNNRGAVDLVEFANAAVCFDPASPHDSAIGEERIKYIFRVYDLNGDGKIDASEVSRTFHLKWCFQR